MKTQYYTATSLDGFIATLDDSLEWLFPLGNLAETGLPRLYTRCWRRGDGFELARQFASPNNPRVPTVYDHGLLDEIIAQVGSVTLGSGKPLLPRAITKPPLRLISARAIGTGFAELRYEVPKINDGIPQPESGEEHLVPGARA